MASSSVNTPGSGLAKSCCNFTFKILKIDTAIYLDPQNLAYYIEKGLLCYRVKYSDEGIRILTEAEPLAPASPDVHYLLARLYIQKGVTEVAVSHLHKAVEYGHPDAKALLEELEK